MTMIRDLTDPICWYGPEGFGLSVSALFDGAAGRKIEGLGLDGDASCWMVRWARSLRGSMVTPVLVSASC